jgi:hypothetical protein
MPTTLNFRVAPLQNAKGFSQQYVIFHGGGQHLATQQEVQLWEHVVKLRAELLRAADRVAAQSELLTSKAEAAPVLHEPPVAVVKQRNQHKRSRQ